MRKISDAEAVPSTMPIRLEQAKPEHREQSSAVMLWLRRCCWMLIGAGAGVGAMHLGSMPGEAPPPAVQSAKGKAVPMENLEDRISLIGYPFAVRTMTLNGTATLEIECTKRSGQFIIRVEQRTYVVCATGEGTLINSSISDVRHEDGDIVLHSTLGTVHINGQEFTAMCGTLALRPGGSAKEICSLHCKLRLSPAGQFFHRLHRPGCEIPGHVFCILEVEEQDASLKR